MFNRLQATYSRTDGAISDLAAVETIAAIGPTPDPCGFLPPSLWPNGEPHGSNGARDVSTSGASVYQLNEGRLGTLGQIINLFLNGTTPWIWSAIRFDADGRPLPVDHGMFPSYSVYVDGNLLVTFPQSPVGEFVLKDETYQRLPSQIQ